MTDDFTPETREPAEGQPLVPSGAPHNRSLIQRVFFGADGLRAGWSILLFGLIAALASMAMNAMVRRVHLIAAPVVGSEVTANFMLTVEGISVGVVLLAAWLVSRVEKRSFSRYGLDLSTRRLRQFAIGWLWGLLVLSLLVGKLWAENALVITGVLLRGLDILRWGLIWLLGFLCVSLLEEFLTRGFLQYTLTRGLAGAAGALGMGPRQRRFLSFWASALLFSFAFGLGHQNNPGESPIGLVSAGAIGLIFAFSLWRTGSLLWAIGFHAAWDWAESFLYGVRDSGMLVEHHLLASHPQGRPLISGGLTGPEGSIYILSACVLTVGIVAFTLRSEPGSPSNPTYSPGAR